MGEILIGPYTLPVICTAILALVFQLASKGDPSVIPNHMKLICAEVAGVGLAIFALAYKSNLVGATEIFDFVSVSNYVIYGLITLGPNAVGLNEIIRSVGAKLTSAPPVAPVATTEPAKPV